VIRGLPVLFFLSGALGLVYEVLWVRRLTTVFGATTLAVTATLSGFFLGLALGSLTLGMRSRRWRRPLVAFGLLEIGVGLGALLFQPILGLYRDVYPLIHLRLAGVPAGFALVKLVLAAVAVAIPTFCMGATLPALGEAVAPSGQRLGIPVGGLYAINLLGAAAGTLAVPFVLLPRLGVDKTYACAVAGSLTVGLIALAWGASAAVPDRSPASPARSVSRLVLALSAISGLATLSLQTLWVRMFALVHENSVYAFAVVLFVFIIGLSAGAALARRELAWDRPPRALLGAAWCIAGLLVVASPRFFAGLTGGLAYVSAQSWHGALARLLAVAAATMLPAALALGTALPLVMEMAGAGGRDAAGPVIGRVLAANTLGAMAGPVIATFVMGPLLGLWPSLAILGGLLVFAGAWTGLPRVPAAVAVAILAGEMVVGATDLPPVRVRASEGERLLWVREGTHGTTAVLATDHDRWITVNNSYVLGGTAVGDEERWQAHLPLLIHPSPRRVAFLGMGTGITAGAALMHPVGSVVALEIVPEVAEAARQDFAEWNARVVDDRRVEVVVDDGRNYLASTPAAFDVIVGDLLVPWRPAEAPLYTREHFASVRAALSADGVFCQWLPLYQLSPDQLAIIARTFLDVFPSATLWRGNFDPGAATLALVGQRGAGPLDVAGIDDRLHRLVASGERNAFLQHPAGMWLFLVGPLRPTLPWISAARLNRDGEPWVEMLSPLAHDARGQAEATSAQVAGLLDHVAREPLSGTALRGLDDRHQAWVATGRELSRASLVRGEDGQRRVLDILRTLPPELQHSLEVGP